MRHRRGPLQEFLDVPLTVNGGGSDLVFRLHEFSVTVVRARPNARVRATVASVIRRLRDPQPRLGPVLCPPLQPVGAPSPDTRSPFRQRTK